MKKCCKGKGKTKKGKWLWQREQEEQSLWLLKQGSLKLIGDIVVEAGLKSKALYKTGLLLLKMIPILLALCCLCNSILSYFNLDVCVLSYVGGISVIPLIFLYLASYMFRFCEYYRMFLHYIVITWIINIIDYYIGIPIDDLEYLCL